MPPLRRRPSVGIEMSHAPAAHRPAAAVLGAEHPVARAAAGRAVLCRQLLVTSGLLPLALGCVVVRGTAAVPFVAATLLVGAWLGFGLAAATSCLHERARDVIADGDGTGGALEIAIERDRLALPRTRDHLARSLERALDAAEHWREISVASRPPAGVRRLVAHAALVREIAALVRDPATGVRGVALLHRLLSGGFAASIYDGDPRLLAQELARRARRSLPACAEAEFGRRYTALRGGAGRRRGHARC